WREVVTTRCEQDQRRGDAATSTTAAAYATAAASHSASVPVSHAAAKFVSVGGVITLTARTSAALSAASSAIDASSGGATRYAIGSPGDSPASRDRYSPSDEITCGNTVTV